MKYTFTRLMNLVTVIIFVFSTMSVTVIATAMETGRSKHPSTKYHLVWSEFDGKAYQIFYTKTVDDRWEGKKQLSFSDVDSVVPCVGATKNGAVWVAWSDVGVSDSKLMFTVFSNQRWTKAKEINTGFTENTGSSLIIDTNNMPWLVWAGYDGIDDDIYFTRWNGKGWEAPERIHADNDFPDIIPVIGMNPKGVPWVIWSGFDGSKYQLHRRVWDGNGWQRSPKSQKTIPIAEMLKDNVYDPPELPYFVTDPLRTSLFKGEGEIQSIPLRFRNDK